MFSKLALFALATVAAASGPAPVNLGTAGNYAVIAKAGVSTVPQSNIIGDLAASPVANTYYTGFSRTHSDTGSYSTSTQVTGRLFAANDMSPTPSVLTTAVSDMETAFVDAAGRSDNATLNIGAGTVSGITFASGLYTWGTDLEVTGDCYVNGSATDTWIFQVAGDLTVASAVKLILSGGANAGNIVFVVSGAVTLGSTAQWNGVVLGKTAIHMNTGASTNGRMLAQTAVTLQAATINSNGLFAANATANATESASRKRMTRYSSQLF